MSLKKSQLALSNYPYFKHSFDYTFDSLERLGAEAIELYACDPHFHIDDTDLPQVIAVKKSLRKRGLRPICLTPEQVKYPINIAAENPVARKRSIGTYVKCIQYAHELECPTVQFHAGFNLLDRDNNKTWQRSIESLSYLADIAEGYGITITMESAHKLCTVLTGSDKVAQMVDDVGSPNLRGMIDTLCLVYCNEDAKTAIRNIGPEHLRHVHFSDCYISHPKDHLIPGEGDMDLEGVLGALDRAGYGGYITIEMLTPYEYNPEEAMSKAADWMRARLAD